VNDRRRSDRSQRWPVRSLVGCLVGILLASGAATAASGTNLTASATPSKLGVASSRYLKSDPERLNRIGASWAYDWSATPPPRDPHLDWVPMIWGSRSVTSSVLDSLRRARRTGEAQDLLGFNEPDSSSQADMTPVQAAALWPKLESTGLQLGSPAPAVPTDGWLAEFMKLARQRRLRVDFIALHYYQDFTNPDAVDQLHGQLVAIHNLYHKPIWITEIGALDIRSFGEYMLRDPTAARATGYMRRLFAMLNALPFVTRYAWFTDDCWNDSACRTSSLFNGSGRLTTVGSEFESTSKAMTARAGGPPPRSRTAEPRPGSSARA
jgi:hypothetical protein